VKTDPGFADAFYVSFAWRKCAAGYKMSVGGLCEECLKQGLITPAQEVHHKIHLTPQTINIPEIALNWDNLEALCKDCHLKQHRKQKRWQVDESGAVVPRDHPP